MSQPRKSKKEEEDEAFAKWDPMATDYNSIQNLMALDIGENAGAFILGVKDKDRPWSEVPCPFYNGIGNFCWKGQSCRMKHEITDPTDLGKERTSTIYTLDDKPILHRGMWLQVTLQHVISPSEFYIIPTISPVCGCEAVFPSKDDADLADVDGFHCHRGDVGKIRTVARVQDFGTGLSAFEMMKTKLSRTLDANMAWRSLQSPSYEMTELVAVKINVPTNGRRSSRTWFRGQVLKANIFPLMDREINSHRVQLLDTGKEVEVSGRDVCALPEELCYHHAMAFKCCLDGVNPVGSTWKKNDMADWGLDAIEEFKNLTAGQDLLMKVKSAQRDGDMSKTTEFRPYLVDLFRPSGKGSPPSSVAQELVENGMAVWK